MTYQMVAQAVTDGRAWLPVATAASTKAPAADPLRRPRRQRDGRVPRAGRGGFRLPAALPRSRGAHHPRQELLSVLVRDLSSLSFVISMYSLMFGDISYLITTYLAVQKACCVAIPLHFKNVFTRSRSVFTLVFIYGLAFTYYCPIFASMACDVRPLNSSKTGSAQLFIVLSPLSRELIKMFRLVNKTVLPFATQTVVIVCLAILTVHLKNASRFRMTLKSGKGKSLSDSSDVKGLRAIQSVTLVSAIFVASNMPDICINIATMLVPEFNDRKFYNNLYWVVEECSNVCPIINSAVLILVYLKYNKNYYKNFISLFQKTK
ncbi:hypothetical protein Btru_021567 [Bulinus truncatus]|nr:hypothetical protein Btru_021567 [Bulinus truncatus]